MPIPIPVTKTIISSPVWGIPITNEVNRLTDQYRMATSTTRPTGVANGTMIFETDTGRIMVWRSASNKWRGIRSNRYVADGGGGTTSGNAQTVMNSLNIPDPGCDGWTTIWAHFYWNQSVASDAIWFRVKDGASELAQYRAPYGAGVAVTSMTADLTATVQTLTGAGTKVIQLVASRESGSGTATVYPDPTLNKMHAIFTPDA
jgi:hypothetical protein